MKLLFFYNSSQTFTNTVFDHLNSFNRYSKHECYFSHHDGSQEVPANALDGFDGVVIHYSVRLPYDQISESASRALSNFRGLKVLFIQDEYNNTWHAWKWIRKIGFHLVFTVVPERFIDRVYPRHMFLGTQFVNNLTGYCPDYPEVTGEMAPVSSRPIFIGYRGRPLPLEYGELGREKVSIGKMVKNYCKAEGFSCDIEWTEEKRIYGDKWNVFISQCRAMLGSESGCNVFDWDGTLARRIGELKLSEPGISEDAVCERVIKPGEIPGLMNQISPRIFEAAYHKTVLVLYEGTYSGVLVPHVHYLPLKKDGSNIREVFEKLKDDKFVEQLGTQTHRDLIQSQKYSYHQFVSMFDQKILEMILVFRLGQAHVLEGVGAEQFAWTKVPLRNNPLMLSNSQPLPETSLVDVTEVPIRNNLVEPLLLHGWFRVFAIKCWLSLPDILKAVFKPILRPVFIRE